MSGTPDRSIPTSHLQATEPTTFANNTNNNNKTDQTSTSIQISNKTTEDSPTGRKEKQTETWQQAKQQETKMVLFCPEAGDEQPNSSRKSTNNKTEAPYTNKKGYW